MQCSFQLGKDGDPKAIYSDQRIDTKSKGPLVEIHTPYVSTSFVRG